MGLIKSNVAPVAVTAFSMRDVESRAAAMLAEASRRVEGLLAEAQQEAERLRQEARAKGLAEGRREGLEKGTEEGRKLGQQQALAEHKAQLAQLVGSLAGSVAELDAARAQLESEALRDVVALAAAIARRVTKRQGLIDSEVLAANLSEAMKLVVGGSDLRVAISPAQRKAFDDVLPQLQVTWPALRHAEIVEDPMVTPGGCRLFTRGGEVDADLEGQLDRVIDELLPPRDRPIADAPALSAPQPAAAP